MGAEDRRVVAGARLVQRRDEGADPRGHHEQVPRRLTALRVAVGMRCPLRCEYRLAWPGLDDLVADPELERALEHVPRLVIAMVDMQRCDPLPLGVSGIPPFDDHKVAVRAAELLSGVHATETITPMVGPDANAVVTRLRELDTRSGGQRVAWSAVWRQERSLLDALARELVPDVRISSDAFANRWYVLDGESADSVLLGSHTDCVPGGGWLDGVLGIHAGLEVLRVVADDGGPRHRTVALVDWADEEGVRFGRSLLGSSAACGSLSRTELERLSDADGRSAAEVVSEFGFDAERLGARVPELGGVACALELHIEQGPILEASGRRVAAVAGCLGVTRARYVLRGRSGHAGATPMTLRADPVRAAAEAIAAISGRVDSANGLATVGQLAASPGIPTAIAAECAFTLDLRHEDASRLEELSTAARAEIEAAATRHRCELSGIGLWSIAPVNFDPALVEQAVRFTDGGAPLRSGPLHDSAALAGAGIPTVMVFAPSVGGVSHTREEDTPDDALVEAIERFAALAIHLIRN